MNNNSPPLEEAMKAFELWFKQHPNGGLFKYYKWTFKIEKK